MSIAIPARGRHSAAHVIDGLRSQIRELTADKEQLALNGYRLADEIHEALIRGCQDAMLIAQLRAENTAVKAANEEWRRTVIRAKAEQARLRQAVISARPRIHQVPTELVRPYSPEVVLPYVSPVPYRSTANDETQQLPVIELPMRTH